jgi:preprotein translocase subunit SecG
MGFLERITLVIAFFHKWLGRLIFFNFLTTYAGEQDQFKKKEIRPTNYQFKTNTPHDQFT